MDQLHTVYEKYQDIALLHFPYAYILIYVGAALYGSVKVYDYNKGKKPYWLYSYVSVVIAAFGGGFLAPALIGKPASPVGNDLCLPIALVAWYSVHYIPGVYDLVTMTIVKAVWYSIYGLYRTYTVCKFVKEAATVLKAGEYYPTPLVGPILVGTLLGCGALFLPADKGLKGIHDETPWAVQGAFITATTYHFLIVDKDGWFGNTARAIVGYQSDDTVRTVLATMHVSTLLMQLYYHDDHINFFTPIHRLLYLFFQVNGPTKEQKEEKKHEEEKEDKKKNEKEKKND